MFKSRIKLVFTIDSIIWHVLPRVLHIYLWLDDLDALFVAHFIAKVARAKLIVKKQRNKQKTKKKAYVGSHLHHYYHYLKVPMARFFLSSCSKEVLKCEEWSLFYCYSCRVIQDFDLCKLDDCDVATRR